MVFFETHFVQYFHFRNSPFKTQLKITKRMYKTKPEISFLFIVHIFIDCPPNLIKLVGSQSCSRALVDQRGIY